MKVEKNPPLRLSNLLSVTRKLIAISSGNEHVSAYLSPVMSMSVTKPLPGNRARRSSDSFEEFDLNLKTQVQHVVQYEYRKLWWKNQVHTSL